MCGGYNKGTRNVESPCHNDATMMRQSVKEPACRCPRVHRTAWASLQGAGTRLRARASTPSPLAPPPSPRPSSPGRQREGKARQGKANGRVTRGDVRGLNDRAHILAGTMIR